MFFRRFLFGVVCLSIVGCASRVIEPELVAAEKEIVLVQDIPADEIMPKNFRTADTIHAFLEKEKSVINTRALVDLRASGSAGFSETALTWLKQRLGEGLIIVDLRQESHGFINGAAVTWYAQNNWVNLGKTREQALQDEIGRLDALARDKAVCVYDAEAIKHKIKDPGRFVEIEQVRSEQQLAKQYNIRYFRLTVPDHMRPSDEDVDRFVAFVCALEDEDRPHFHCRAGIGRTTTFLVMYDMMHNADRVSMDDIVARQVAVLSNYDLLKVKSKKLPGETYKNRADFLRLFYEYAKAFCAGDKASWSEWLGGREKIVGPIFRGRYKSILVDENNYGLKLSVCIHLNPVRAKITDDIKKYPWSSFWDYVGMRKPFDRLDTTLILSQFNDDLAEARGKYKRFVLENIDMKSPLEKLYKNIALGEEDFRRRIDEKIKEKEGNFRN